MPGIINLYAQTIPVRCGNNGKKHVRHSRPYHFSAENHLTAKEAVS
jgi:hypothetical protein